MEATTAAYNYIESLGRIDEILATPAASFQKRGSIPARSELSFVNGFYVQVTVLYVDIRKSKALADQHTRPVLAKIYRSFISEVVSVLRSVKTISEVSIEGDGVWGVYGTSTKKDVEGVFECAAQVASLIDILNIRLDQNGYQTFSVGIGLEDGDCLYIKAGSKGSGINDVVWVGQVVGEAAKLCKYGNQTLLDHTLMVSELVYGSLKEEYQNLLSWSDLRGCFEGNVYNIEMNKWVSNEREK